MKDLLWDMVSRFVRISAADQYGFARCYTCGARKKWQELECGHYIGRYHGATKYLLDNLAPQCFRCNHELGGNTEVFREKLIMDLGLERVEAIERMSRGVNKISKSDREEMIEDYKGKIKQLRA